MLRPLFFPRLDQAVDGVIAAAAGPEMRRICAELPLLDLASETRCNVGEAVATEV